MKETVKGIVLHCPDTAEEGEKYQDDVYDATEKLEQLTNGEYGCGSDDGKDFFFVPEHHIDKLQRVFPNESVQDLDKGYYPWDYDYIRDKQYNFVQEKIGAESQVLHCGQVIKLSKNFPIYNKKRNLL